MYDAFLITYMITNMFIIIIVLLSRMHVHIVPCPSGGFTILQLPSSQITIKFIPLIFNILIFPEIRYK